MPVDTTVSVSGGQMVALVQRAGASPPARSHMKRGAEMPGLEVMYEDDHLACVIKPNGLPTQGKGRCGRGRYVGEVS